MASASDLGLRRLFTHWARPDNLQESVDCRRAATWVATAARSLLRIVHARGAVPNEMGAVDQA